MIKYFNAALFAATIASCFLGYPHSSSADEGAAAEQTASTQTPEPHHHGGFRLGVCVGQTLAEQGVKLSETKGDTTQRDAFKAAVETCRAQFKNRTPASTSSSN